MKPVVVHLIGDKSVGGSNLYVNRLVNSRLRNKYQFFVFKLDEFKSQIEAFKLDLIIFHYPCTWKHSIELIGLKRYGKIIILDHHYCQGFESDRVSVLWRFHLMLKLAYSMADKVLCVSLAQKQWLLSRQLLAPKKIRLIPISVSGAAKIEDLLKVPLKLPKYSIILGAYGRFARQKGFDVLLKAIALLPPQDFFLYLGGYGFESAIIQDLARELPNVKLVGKVEDVPAFLSLCDAVIIPSRWETGGIVCLEAKAAGKPVIASSVDALPEYVDDCGLLVPPNDPEQLAKAIASLREKDLTTWGEAARKSVIGSWEKFLTNWESLLQEVL